MKPVIKLSGRVKLALAAALVLTTPSSFAQTAVIGGGGPSVSDVEYCNDGECVVIGEKKTPNYVQYPVTHVFPAGKIPRKANGKTKAQKYFYDDLNRAIRRVKSSVDKNTGKIIPGEVHVHPGDHEFEWVDLSGPPKKILIKGVEPDIGRAYLKAAGKQCFYLHPDFSDDAKFKNIGILLESLVIAPQSAIKSNSLPEPSDACIDASRVELTLDDVKIVTGGREMVAVRVNNKTTTIKDSEIVSTTVKNAQSLESAQYNLVPGSKGIEVYGYGKLVLDGVGRSGVTIAGFGKAISAAGAIKISRASLQENFTGLHLHKSDVRNLQRPKDNDDSVGTDPVINGLEISITSLPLTDPKLKKAGILIDRNYDRRLDFEQLYITGHYNNAQSQVGLGVSAADSWYPLRINGGQITKLDKALDLNSDLDLDGVKLSENNIALDLNMFFSPIVKLSGVNFIANNSSFNLKDVSGGEFNLNQILIDPKPTRKPVAAGNWITVTPALTRRDKYPVRCSANTGSLLYKNLKKKYVCKF